VIRPFSTTFGTDSTDPLLQSPAAPPSIGSLSNYRANTMHTENEEDQRQGRSLTRSIRLTPEVIARLQAVCDHLGVTVSAYMTAEIGRAVARDEVSLQAKRSADNSLEMLARMIQEATKEDNE